MRKSSQDKAIKKGMKERRDIEETKVSNSVKQERLVRHMKHCREVQLEGFSASAQLTCWTRQFFAVRRQIVHCRTCSKILRLCLIDASSTPFSSNGNPKCQMPLKWHNRQQMVIKWINLTRSYTGSPGYTVIYYTWIICVIFLFFCQK